MPNPTVSALGSALVGAVQGTSPACVANLNIIPGSACGITCGPGQTSTDSAKSVVYSCPSVRPSDGKPTNPTIICGPCTIDQCSLCPSDPGCAQCNDGYKLSTATPPNTCEIKATVHGTHVNKDHTNLKGTYCSESKEYVFVVWETHYKMSTITLAEARANINKDFKGRAKYYTASDGSVNLADAKEPLQEKSNLAGIIG